MSDLLQAENLQKSFGALQAVREASLRIAPGEIVAIMGRSGSGKTTLLHLLAGLERPTTGQILYRGEDIDRLDEDALALWRRANIGLVFQAFHLIPTLSAVENVAFPLTRCDLRQRNAMHEPRHTWTRWVLRIAPSTALHACQAGNSNAWQSRAPSSTIHR